ncbi:MAG: hypothetical protein IJB59_06105 [Oscillospiraceae bacterium]|nr:hypothetical protein [Oscillospiraceae bacterium]
MEQYKENLKLQNILFGICGTILGLFSLFSWLGQLGILPFFEPTAGDSHWQSMWRGLVSGASFGLLALMLFGLAKNTRALRSEKDLKKLYIKEHDERTIQIWTSARAAAYQVFLILGLVAIVVSGYFSMTVSLTILACVFCSSVIGLLFMLYYRSKF